MNAQTDSIASPRTACFTKWLLAALACVSLGGCEQPQQIAPGDACSLDYDTLVELQGWLKRPATAVCEARRNLGPQCSYYLVSSADAPAQAEGASELSVLQGQASNQVEEFDTEPSGIPRIVAHDMGNVPIENAPVRVRGRVFPGLRDPSSCRVEVIQIRHASPT